MAMVQLNGLVLSGKRVLMRCDFNVPLKDGAIADPARIDASLDTIRYVLGQGGCAVLCSHLGRPKERSPELSLRPVAQYLSNVLGIKVALAPDCVGEVTLAKVEGLAPGEALLLENLRFHPEEEKNDTDFAHELARGKDVYVNDAFGTAHRAHASTVGVVRFLGRHAPGFLMMRELEALRSFTENPPHPYVAILGGAKVSDKISLLKNLVTKVDTLLIGGAMAYTFLRSQAKAVGSSRVEEDKITVAADLMAEAAQRGVSVVLPLDHVAASGPDDEAGAQVVSEIRDGLMGLDIGPRTAEAFIAALSEARTVIWNGPLGYFERPAFAHGTLKVGEALAGRPETRSLIGGGDTAAALSGQPWSHNFTHISTGGGATLEYLEGRELPGVKALDV